MNHLFSTILFLVALMYNIQAQVKIGGTGSPHYNACLKWTAERIKDYFFQSILKRKKDKMKELIQKKKTP